MIYSNVFGRGAENTPELSGACVENSARMRCLDYNVTGEEPVASYDVAKDTCVLTTAWYERQCTAIGGFYDNSMCYVKGLSAVPSDNASNGSQNTGGTEKSDDSTTGSTPGTGGGSGGGGASGGGSSGGGIGGGGNGYGGDTGVGVGGLDNGWLDGTTNKQNYSTSMSYSAY